MVDFKGTPSFVKVPATAKAFILRPSLANSFSLASSVAAVIKPDITYWDL